MNFNQYIIKTVQDHGCTVKTIGCFTIIAAPEEIPENTTKAVRNLMMECNGVVLCDNEVVCRPLTRCFTADEFTQQEICTVETCEDATVLRLWWNPHSHEWSVSTTRCIDANTAFWSSQKSFAQLMYETLYEALATNGSFAFEKLSKDYTYTLGLQHPENLQVIPVAEPRLIHLGTRNTATGEEVNVDIGLQKPQTHSCETIGHLKVALLGLTPCQRGYIVKTANGNRYKFDSMVFTEMAKARGNTPNILTRYYQLISDYNTKNLLRTFYPMCQWFFDQIEQAVWYLAKIIQNDYYQIYIRHNETHQCNKLYQQTLKQLHAQYLNGVSQGFKQPTTQNVVYEKLTKLPVSVLMNLVKSLSVET